MSNNLEIDLIIDRKSESVALFTNARDEENIVEWAAYHLNIGFDIIYIFDHKSKIPIDTLFNSNKVVVIPFDGNGGFKFELIREAVLISKKMNYDWMLYLDADEILHFNSFINVKNLLQAYNMADALSINWLFFGSNFHKKTPNGLLIENYTKSELILNKHVKTFVRPKAGIYAVGHPHYFNMHSTRLFCLPNKAMEPRHPFNPINIPYTNIDAYIAHYTFQSEETYIKRKCILPRDDIGSFREPEEDIHLKYNNYENTTIKDKYANRVKKIMKIIGRV